MRKSHLFWYMLLFIDHRKIRSEFSSCLKAYHQPPGFALWHQKNKAYWISSLPAMKPNVMVRFRGWGVTHMNGRPAPGEIEFIGGDRSALRY